MIKFFKVRGLKDRNPIHSKHKVVMFTTAIIIEAETRDEAIESFHKLAPDHMLQSCYLYYESKH